MSDLPNAPVSAPTAATAAVATATAPADPAPVVDPNKVVTSVVQTVQSHPAIPQNKVASVAASILGSLYQAEPAIFAVTRASPQTQAEIALGLGLAEVIGGAFLPQAG